MASRRSRKVNGGEASSRSSALEQLRTLREGGGRRIDTFTLKEEDKIYDSLPEKDYALLVAKRRLESKDFVVEDDGLGYGDIGEEENWEVSGMPASSEDEEVPKKQPPEAKKKRIVSGKKDRELKAAAALMGKQNVSSMFAAASGTRGKTGAPEEADSVLNDVLASVGAADVDRDRRKHRRVGGTQRRPQADLFETKRSAEPELQCLVEEPEAEPAKADEAEAYVQPDFEPSGTIERDAETAMSSQMEAEPILDHTTRAEPEAEAESEVRSRRLEPEAKPIKAPPKVEPVCEPFRRPQGEAGVEAETEQDFTGDTTSLPLDDTGKLQFYFLDAYEEAFGANAGKIFLFGKVRRGERFVSSCVVVGNMQRCLFVLPSPSIFPNNTISCLEQEMKNDPVRLKGKLQDLARDLKMELAEKLVASNVSSFSMEPVKRSYAFERSDVNTGTSYFIKLKYPYKDPLLPSNLKGEHFSGLFGANTSALEVLLIKRKIKGPCWLSISNPIPCSSATQVSWCKVEVAVSSLKEITVAEFASPVETPKLVVASLNLKTILNQKSTNEIVSASVVFCQHVKIDAPMPPSEWNNHRILGHFSFLRKLDGCTFPAGFASEVTRFNNKAGSIVLSCEGSERALLNRLMVKLHQLDADVLVGHNISAFDVDVLLHRLQACKVPNNLWSRIGRLKRSQMPRLVGGGTSYGGGASLGAMTCVAGRLLCDTYLSARELLKEVSYSLTELSKSQLSRDRREIAPSDIPNMYQSSTSLFELVEAAESDAWLSLSLMFHLSVLPLTRQLTNISGNLWSKTLQGARAQRVEYLLLHEFHGRKFILPDKASKNDKDQMKQKRKIAVQGAEEGNEPEEKTDGRKKGPAYLGGLVLEPKKGLYDKYILLLDFNSLYPSIIQEYNICFTTVERPSDGSIPPLPSTDTTGVLPQVLRALVERRKQVKQWLKKTSDIMKYQQLDIQQQALKLTANSMYGCLGFPNSRFYAKSIAELITSQGREILQSTVDHVQNVLNLEVIYGDTDSIMINTGLDDISLAKSVAGKVIKEVNKKYKLLEIDLDGVFKRMLLLKKKKYASVKIEANADGSYREVIEQKGLDIVRRDWSVLSKDIGNFVLQQILSGGSREEVVDAIHSQLRTLQDDMRNGRIDSEKYIITKSLTKAPEDYPDSRNQPHVQVALRRKQCGHRCFPGDTIPYIICYEEGAATASIADRARHPEELQKDKGNWMIDIDYYLSQQVHPVVSRLCAPIEGTDPSHIAECLGLDSSRFQQRFLSTAVDKEEALLSSSIFDDEDRYKRCESLELVCPSCFNTYPFAGVSSLLGLTTEGRSEAGPENPLECPKCSRNEITAVMLANMVTQRAAEFIERFYDFLMVCDDEMCNHTTRDSILRVVGDAEKGSVCPNYPRCNGHLVRQYTQADLYNQLTYFCRLLDATRALDKIQDTTARIAAEKRALPLRATLDLAEQVMKELRDKCTFRWVEMSRICAG